ncbi:hypothetical protein ACFFJX_09255 [Pseudarcicella hirudinis]|uniref:hypothetical protein n=1 Tax=Pseudarcicella hirudinis TaxID=1079859 RepID=UPI0035F0DE99
MQSEINRSPITTKEFGTKLNGGGSFDNIVFGQWRFNEIGVSDKNRNAERGLRLG